MAIPSEPTNDGTYRDGNAGTNTHDNTQLFSSPPLTSPVEVGHDSTVTTSRKETLRELKRDLVAAKKRVAKLETAIRSLEGLDAEEPAVTTETNHDGPSYPLATLLVLQKAKRPMKVRQLLEALAKNGKPVTTMKPYRTMYKVLKSHPEMFVNVEGKWALAKEASE